MLFSYLISQQELSVLAHFSNITNLSFLQNLPTLSDLPTLTETETSQAIETLKNKGMLHINKNEASVDIIVYYILTEMSTATEIISQNNTFGYCSEIYIAVSKDEYSKRYRIKPFQNKQAMLQELAELAETEEVTQ
ncbi:MAG: hypothetical protein FWG64_06480 [Firmicutes bacterium]|nr:hypothetical protein [Bacillota bacterium]